jgi:putative Mg2+ transporter-C (MgtC) family protein
MRSLATGPLGPTIGQGWREAVDLGAAMLLCSLIGLERQVRGKSAGLRTHGLVGPGAALFMLISKYGFLDVGGPEIALDPSRVAAQIVSGIGFIGSGLIFVRRDSVRGRTTAAVVWVTAAVGAACGAGMLLLVGVVTLGHYLAVIGFPYLIKALPAGSRRQSPLRLQYVDGQAVLRCVLATTTGQGFSVAEVETLSDGETRDGVRTVELELHVEGAGALDSLVTAFAQIDGVLDTPGGSAPRSSCWYANGSRQASRVRTIAVRPLQTLRGPARLQQRSGARGLVTASMEPGSGSWPFRAEAVDVPRAAVG